MKSAFEPDRPPGWRFSGFLHIILNDFCLFQRAPVVATSWQSALQADSDWSSHPISVKVQRPEEIDDIFDTISYQKVRRPKYQGLNVCFQELLTISNKSRGEGGYLSNFLWVYADSISEPLPHYSLFCGLSPISIYWYSASNNRLQHEALGNKLWSLWGLFSGDSWWCLLF